MLGSLDYVRIMNNNNDILFSHPLGLQCTFLHQVLGMSLTNVQTLLEKIRQKAI